LTKLYHKISNALYQLLTSTQEHPTQLHSCGT